MEDRRTATRSSRVREHLRTNVVGYIAIFLFAIGGTATALQGRNTVDSGDIKNKQVKRADISPNAVNGSRVANQSLRGDDINEGTLGQVPAAANALNAAALGGIPASEFVRANPALTGRTVPFLSEGTLNANSPVDALDLGFVLLRGGDNSILVCNDHSSEQMTFQFSEEHALTGTANLSPTTCMENTTAGAGTVQLAAEIVGEGAYAFLLDANADGVFHVWWLQ